jgi:transcriptional antiterminator RfaH
MSEALAPWIVVNTHPHKEASAISNLQNQGFNTYCPMLRKRVRHARRTTNVLRPLFPGYLFIEFADQSLSWRPILSTVGVRTVVRNGEEPCRLDSRSLAGLRFRAQDGVTVAPPVPYAAAQK